MDRARDLISKNSVLEISKKILFRPQFFVEKDSAASLITFRVCVFRQLRNEFHFFQWTTE